MPTLSDRLQSLCDRVADNNRWRQQECFNLIPSEMSPSVLVRLCEISDPSGRYAEHRRLGGEELYYYQGTGFIREIEVELQAQLGEFFGCKRVEPRPISGQMANAVVFNALLRLLNGGEDTGRRIRGVVNNELMKGGHLSAQPMGALFNMVDHAADGKPQVWPVPVQEQNPYRPDTPRLLELIRNQRPELVVLGKSMFLHPEPVSEVADLIRSEQLPTLLHYDMAHVLGLYGAFQAPLAEGADVVTGSTHKTFFGTQRGVILVGGSRRARDLWGHVRNRAHPGATSNHHLGTLVGLLAATYEMAEYREPYQDQVGRNAKAFAVALKQQGLDVQGDPEAEFTDTHQVIMRIDTHGTGEEVASRLEASNIIVNYQALPDDESFRRSGGIRLGVQEMTRFGMQESDFGELAARIRRVVVDKQQLTQEIAQWRSSFTSMRYCLPAAQAAPLAKKLWQSLGAEEVSG